MVLLVKDDLLVNKTPLVFSLCKVLYGYTEEEFAANGYSCAKAGAIHIKEKTRSSLTDRSKLLKEKKAAENQPRKWQGRSRQLLGFVSNDFAKEDGVI